MSAFKAFLWPDHVIGKRESRQIREEHNALYNSHAELLAACLEARGYVESFARSMKERGFEAMAQNGEACLSSMNRAVEKAEGKKS